MVKLCVMKLGFRTNPNNSLCLDHVWDVTHIRSVLGMILMCVGSVGVIHGSKVWKNMRKHTFWAFPSDFYRYN